MAKYLTQGLVLLFSFTAASSLTKRDYPDPICTGLCQGQIHDPSVLRRDDGIYFRFTTNNGINIASAPSIGGPWEHQGHLLPNGSSIDLPGRMNLWAPDVFKYDDLFYCYYSVSESGSQNSDIGVATSSTLEPGSWMDHGSIGIPAIDAYNRIDPNLFQYDASSPFYMAFGSYWDNIFQVPMETPPLTVSGEVVHLQQNTTARPEDLPVGPSEGAMQFRWPVGGTEYYYLFFSSGKCCNIDPNDLIPQGEEYKIMVCRSTELSSGYVDQDGNDCLNENGGTLVLASHGQIYAPGGQGVMYDPDLDGVVLYYHYLRPDVGYEYDQYFFGYNKLDFSSGWPKVVS